MKYGSEISVSLFCLLLSSWLLSCVPQPCYQQTYATVKADFFATGTGKARIPNSVTLYAVGRDTSKIYDGVSGLSIINIPLDASTDSCSFFIRMDTLSDIVTFYYKNYTHLLSKECGYTFYHILTDSVKHNNPALNYLIINNDITTVNEENIRIFY